MKRANPGGRRSAQPVGTGEKAVDEYLAAISEPARSTLYKIRAVIRSVAPEGATETISYRIPTFQYKGPLIGYAAFANHCSLYPMSPAVLDTFRDELSRYETSKGTIRFPVDKPLSPALIRKLVKARIAQNELRKQR